MKRIVISLVILVVLVLMVIRVYRTEDRPVETPTLPGLTQDAISSIEINRKEGTGEKAKEIHILLQKEDQTWKMKEPVEYKAKEGSIERMLELLTDLTPVDLVASSSALHEKYELTDDLAVNIKVKAGPDKELNLLLGLMRNGHTFARLPGKDGVFRLRGMVRSAFATSVSNYRDRTIFRTDAERIDHVRFTSENGQLEFTRSGGSWAPVGVEIKNFNYRKFEGVVSMLAGMNTRDFMDGNPTVEESGITDDSASVWLHVAPESEGKDAGVKGPGEEHVIRLGNEHPDTRTVYALIDSNPQHFLISKHTAERLKPKAEDYEQTDEEIKKMAEQDAQRALRELEGNPLDGTKGTFIRPEFREDFKKSMQ